MKTAEMARAELERRRASSNVVTPEMARAELERRKASHPTRNVGKAETIVRNVAQGITFNAADEISSGIGAIYDFATGKKGLSEGYNSRLDAARAQDAEIARQRPVLATVSQAGGGIASLPMGMGARATTALGRIAQTGAQGGTYGALSGFGAGEGVDDRLRTAATGAGIGAVTGGALQAAGEGIGAGARAVRNATSVDKTAARELAEQGIEVSRATAGGDFVKSYIRKNLAPSTFGGKGVQSAAGRVQGQIEDVLEKAIQKTGKSATDPTSGGELVRGALDKASGAFKQEMSKLDDAFEVLVDKSVKGDAKNTLNLVDDLSSEFSGTATSQAVRGVASEADDTIRNVVNALNEDSKSGKLTLGLLLQTRRDIGTKLKDVPFGDARQGALKRLYGALSRDIEGVLDNKTTNLYWNAQNMPQKEGVLKAWKDRNRFYAQGLATLKGLERKFGDSKSAEQVFRAVTGATKLNTKELTTLFGSMSPSARDSLRASVLRKMASGGSDDFTQGSVKTFVQGWNKLSPASKRALGVNVGELDKLARNYERVAPLVSALPENGFQAGASVVDGMTALLSIGGGMLNPSLALAGVLKFGGDAVLSRVLTNPRTLKLAAEAMESQAPNAAQAAIRAMLADMPDGEAKTLLQQARDKLSEKPGAPRQPVKISITKDATGR